MTGLYVIVSARRQPQLSSRRNGYRHVALDGAHGYVREDHNSGFLGTREGDRVRMSSQWIADIGAVADDPALRVDAKRRRAADQRPHAPHR